MEAALDTDDFFWEKTDPPFVLIRGSKSRQEILKNAIASCDASVLSGSLTEWGDIFIPLFQLLIYIHTPTEIRLKRLHERELHKFGNRILPAGIWQTNIKISRAIQRKVKAAEFARGFRANPEQKRSNSIATQSILNAELRKKNRKGSAHELGGVALVWASQYDNGSLDMRSAQHHAEWLRNIPCPIIRLDGSLPV